MARITCDDQTAAAFKAVREVPRDGLGHWRDAIRRHLNPMPGMTVADIGAGTGAFAAAFSDWFGLSILAVEPSAAMRAQIPRRPGIQVLEGDASALPLPDGSADGAWLSLVIHHIPDLEAAQPGAPEPIGSTSWFCAEVPDIPGGVHVHGSPQRRRHDLHRPARCAVILVPH